MSIGLGVALLSVGALGDDLGRRRVLVLGATVLAASSVLARPRAVRARARDRPHPAGRRRRRAGRLQPGTAGPRVPRRHAGGAHGEQRLGREPRRRHRRRTVPGVGPRPPRGLDRALLGHRGRRRRPRRRHAAGGARVARRGAPADRPAGRAGPRRRPGGACSPGSSRDARASGARVCSPCSRSGWCCSPSSWCSSAGARRPCSTWRSSPRPRSSRRRSVRSRPGWASSPRRRSCRPSSSGASAAPRWWAPCCCSRGRARAW